MKSTECSQVQELFARYWDDALSQEESARLSELLTRDLEALDLFQFLCLQAVAAAELPPCQVKAQSSSGRQDRREQDKPEWVPEVAASRMPAVWPRRKILAWLTGGLAAGIGAVVLGRQSWPDHGSSPSTQPGLTNVRVVSIQGEASVRDIGGKSIPAGPLPSGATLATRGVGSAVKLLYPDGSSVALSNDASLSIHEQGRVLVLHQGTASAELRPRPVDQRLTVTMSMLSLAQVNDTSITFGQDSTSAEVEVLHGLVSVIAPTGEQMAIVHSGELLTVGAKGIRSQQPIPLTPDEFSWNLAEPLPEGWLVGRREISGGVPFVRCQPWPDPYYGGTVMQQIRSDHQWARGLFRIVEQSQLYVRYRAKRNSLKGQICLCVRTNQSNCSDTGMLEYNGGFEATPSGEWRWIHIPAASMVPNKHTPAFGSPWVAFLVIFNTFEADVGLEVAEFGITSPGQ